MNEVENLKDSKDILDTQNDYDQCIRYIKRISNGENILDEAMRFVHNKMFEIILKNPEIIFANGVHSKNEPISVNLTLESLYILEKVLSDKIKEDTLKNMMNNFDTKS